MLLSVEGLDAVLVLSRFVVVVISPVSVGSVVPSWKLEISSNSLLKAANLLVFEIIFDLRNRRVNKDVRSLWPQVSISAIVYIASMVESIASGNFSAFSAVLSGSVVVWYGICSRETKNNVWTKVQNWCEGREVGRSAKICRKTREKVGNTSANIIYYLDYESL